MADRHSGTADDVLIVSCDIVGHSSVTKHDVQRERVAGINLIVAKALDRAAEVTGSSAGAVGAPETFEAGLPTVVWASGGDGGHVAFCGSGGVDLRQVALDLVVDLRSWAMENEVELRVTAHAGMVTGMRGADERTQLVGDGINVAGWLLGRGGHEGVVVSDAFRQRIVHGEGVAGVVFHDARWLRDKTGRDQKLWLMSIRSDRSTWYLPADEDRERLRQTMAAITDPGREEPSVAALDRDKLGWPVVHYAKRIMQANKDDEEALTALADLPRIHLQYTGYDGQKRVNPFFEYLPPKILGEVAQRAQLMRRGYNEVICRKGDDGDTMFVILSGRVGVYKRESAAAATPSPDPDISNQEGDIVGDLAFALARRRTADLVALTDTVLLSLHYDDVVGRLGTGRHAAFAKLAIAGFIGRKVLEFVSPRVPYLIGPDGTGPLSVGAEPAERALRRLDEHCELIILPENERTVTFDRVNECATSKPKPGLYVLAGGSVRREIDTRDDVLDADDFPLLWVDMPGFAVLPKPKFTAASKRVRVFRIEWGGINDLEPLKREALRTKLLRSSAACFDYDAFISYSNADQDIAQKWEKALQDRGLHVYRDESVPGKQFTPAIPNAIMRSRAIVPLVTRHVEAMDKANSWVAKEIKMHRRFFTSNQRVLPVTFPTARHESVAAGFPPIVATTDIDHRAIDKLAESLLALREGRLEPPYSKWKISRSVGKVKQGER